ncbi:Uncharacterised protein [Algoriella xinjiangensis]|uniref:hypothetical protein n=1 Tax=Algoriella xinjiangensis TaxID=684065 RepID=UPI000F6404DC|nr:hypothetical protein [Algoriella xinjiangensis]VDH16880.1 Uncharacterised protein [Algoriella xinjiangensis]
MNKEYNIKTNGGDEFTFFTNEENTHCINVRVQDELVAGIILNDSEAAEIAKVLQPDLKNVFAKIFEFKESQVLVTKQFKDNDGDNDEYQVSFEYRAIDNLIINQKLCFKKEEHQDKVFENINQEMVNKVFSSIDNDLLNNNMNDEE